MPFVQSASAATVSDTLTPAQRSAAMGCVRSKNTGPELALRRMLHRAGYRYRLHAAGLPGRPDLVFTRRRTAVFVHGCFWHGHSCQRGARAPKANAAYWVAKIARNRERDAEVETRLAVQGWSVLTVWECELKRPAEVLVRLQAALGPPQAAAAAGAPASASAATTSASAT